MGLYLKKAEIVNYKMYKCMAKKKSLKTELKKASEGPRVVFLKA
jgi:hypothetical protein